MRAVAVVLAGLLPVASAGAQGPPKAPEYDVNAEVTVRGEVVEIHESKVATDHPGLHLILKNEEETVEVHACPVRFLRELEFTIEPGDKLAVTGSRRKGTNLIVAREIVKGQLSLILRDKTGAPNWLPR
jgi:DNA/RNA endonuclease YhcR with UshA esterase domain